MLKIGVSYRSILITAKFNSHAAERDSDQLISKKIYQIVIDVLK